MAKNLAEKPVLFRSLSRGRKERRLVDAVAAGEDMDAYLVREGPGRPRREKKRWVPVAKKKKPPPAAESKS